MTIDASLLREAREVLQLYARPAQEMIKLNLYGPREARFASVIVEKNFTVVVSAPLPTPEQRLKELQKESYEQVTELCTLLRRAMTVIEESVAGQVDLLQECDGAIESAGDNIFPPDDEEPAVQESAA